MRKILILCCLLGVWGLSPKLAAAFEQTPAASSPATAETPQTSKPIAVPGLAPDQAVPTEQVGAEKREGLRIPGLGTLGVLPKLDFGLELMYGDSPVEQLEYGASPDTDPDDITIRGSIKRRF